MRSNSPAQHPPPSPWTQLTAFAWPSLHPLGEFIIKVLSLKLDPITFLLGVCLSYCLHCSLYNLIVPIKTTLLIIFSMTKHEILGTFAEFDKNFAFSPSQKCNGNFPFSISYYESKKKLWCVDVLISCKTYTICICLPNIAEIILQLIFACKKAR